MCITAMGSRCIPITAIANHAHINRLNSYIGVTIWCWKAGPSPVAGPAAGAAALHLHQKATSVSAWSGVGHQGELWNMLSAQFM